MSHELNEIKSKFDKIVNDFYDLVSENEAVPKDIEITVQELNDGYSNNVATLSEIFIEANRRNNIALPSFFKKMPIVSSVENYPYPIILISDEQELDAETQKIVRRRCENGYVTFPVILLSDQFFRLAYGENFSYQDIIKTFEDSSNEKVMVFRRTEFKFLQEYITFVKCLFWIHQYRSAVSDMQNTLIYESELNETEMNSADNISGLLVSQRIRAIIQLIDELMLIDKKFEKLTLELHAEIANIRDKYDRKVLEEMTNINAENISPFVLNIDLKYGRLQGYIKDFLMLREISLDYDFITKDLKHCVSDTELAISTNNAKLSLIGTFSSGKTTLINTFLGEREIPLRTSMGHNTAVLMHFFHEKTSNEYYDIIYKEKLTWTIVKPASMDKVIVNKENDSIRILNVEQESNGNYILTYSLIKSREQRSKKIRTGNVIAVKRGDILKPGAPFTVTGKQISQKVEICSKPEIDLIISLLQKTDFCKMKNADESIQEKNKIIVILQRISQIASAKNSTLEYEEFCEKIRINPSATNALQSLTGQNKPTYPTKYRRIEVECNIGLKNERKMLDRKGWIELCGDPNPNANNKPYIFSEQPSCYMLAKELQLHVNTEFLQYCSLTDTPGLGSVTEEHDAITEKFIRDSSGRLLVMIAINARTMDAKYQDLINSIDDIYNNFRKNDKKNVVFILNCFTNLTPEANIKKQVENVSRMLIKYGFNKNNIFVCNLKSALIDKQQTDTMYGYPSYKKFHDFIITEMISSDLTAKYHGIQDNWRLFFKDSKNRINDQLFELESNLNNIQQYRRKLQDTINLLNQIRIDNYHYESNYIVDEFQAMYESVLDAYLNNRKGIFETVRWNAIRSALNNNVEPSLKLCNTELTEQIFDYYSQCIRNIAYYGESQITTPELDQPYNSVAVLELERLKKTLSEADDETHWYNKSSKQNYYTEKILGIIQEGVDQTFEKAQRLCESYSEIVQRYKESVIREKESTLRGLTNEEEMKAHINRLKDVQKNLIVLEERFNRIKFV